MAITLNHTIVPTHDKKASARFFAELFGLEVGDDSYFAPVRINDGLTLLFDDHQKPFEGHHYAFHVSDAEFDAIFGRVKSAGLAFGSGPTTARDGKLNSWDGGRGVYFRDRDGHLLELLTVAH